MKYCNFLNNISQNITLLLQDCTVYFELVAVELLEIDFVQGNTATVPIFVANQLCDYNTLRF